MWLASTPTSWIDSEYAWHRSPDRDSAPGRGRCSGRASAVAWLLSLNAGGRGHASDGPRHRRHSAVCVPALSAPRRGPGAAALLARRADRAGRHRALRGTGRERGRGARERSVRVRRRRSESTGGADVRGPVGLHRRSRARRPAGADRRVHAAPSALRTIDRRFRYWLRSWRWSASSRLSFRGLSS